jgi:hypothetical protein
VFKPSCCRWHLSEKTLKSGFEAISHAKVVEHLPHHPKADDSSTDSAAGICKRKYQKMILRLSMVALWYNTYHFFLDLVFESSCHIRHLGEKSDTGATKYCQRENRTLASSS